MSYIKRIFILACVLWVSVAAVAQHGRIETDLSGKGWSLWLDRAALWSDDSIYLPPVEVSRLPVNPPTIGWERLHAAGGLSVNVPGTVEEHYWGAIGGAIPDTGGNYVGVSWWSRSFSVDPALKGRRITLCFQSVNLRAEVFVNGQLVGYDVIGNTPFEVDATKAVRFGGENRLDIRITDPVGNFAWDDNILMRWGRNLIPAVHGFGGITGGVVLRATDAVSISDVYVQNQPDPHKVKVAVTLENNSGSVQAGKLTLTIHEKGASQAVWTKTIAVAGFAGSRTVSVDANVPAAKLWELTAGASATVVYEARAEFSGGGMADATSQRFGFRWFNVQDKDHDPTFYLNGKRVFIIAAMTRGMWPTNGIFPTPEMARRDLKTMIDLGMNCMLMHRAIGQPMVIDYSDSAGMFTYEEPGGYRVMPNKKDWIDGPDDQARALRREKLRRMVIRDRSFPSMVIYNLKNEENIAPNEYDVADMRMVHELDPSRILTYNSGSDIGGDYHKITPNNPFKLHMYPFNQQLLYDGWWDQHHWVGQSGYVDENYRNPRFFLRGVVNSPRSTPLEDSLYRLDKREVLFFGEEGAFGAMVRLGKIKEELDRKGTADGYREMEHLDYYEAYNSFLDETGFRSAYPTVDSLTSSLGRNLHYFHARNIENVRMSNSADAYNMNGWASESTRTDVVDMYRNPTADPSIIKYYTRPLYVAVKLRHKVVAVGAAPIADFYLINESNLHGAHTLKVSLSGTDFHKEFTVNVTGGEVFGQLLVENVQLPVLQKAGYYTLHASLDDQATGYDDVYVVEEKGNYSGACMVLERDPIVRNYLQAKGLSALSYSANASASRIIVGNAPLDASTIEALLQRVRAGAHLIVLENADVFAQAINTTLMDRPAVYNGGGIIKWGGSGRLFVGKSPMLEGLPQAQGMSWEYQCFYKTTDAYGNGLVSGLRLNHARSEWVAAVGHQGQKDILGALVRVPLGAGSVTLSTLSMLPNLSTDEQSAVVAKRLFLNMLE